MQNVDFKILSHRVVQGDHGRK